MKTNKVNGGKKVLANNCYLPNPILDRQEWIRITHIIILKYKTLFKTTEDLRGETMVTPAKKLEDLIHLAELCVDLLQQNEEHYAEVRR